jgi:hypothetical protein
LERTARSRQKLRAVRFFLEAPERSPPLDVTQESIFPEPLLDIPYEPLPSQRRFHRMRARFKGFSGPVGSGKSAALCHEAIRLAFMNPGRMGLVGAPTYPMLKDATQRALLEFLEEARLVFDHNKSESYITIAEAGAKILLRSMEEYERLRGTNLAWFGLDELTYTHEEAWTRLEGRLRDPKANELCGFAVWTPKGRDWVWRRFIGEPVEGYEMIRAQPFENRFLLNAVPDFYERLRHSYGDKFFEQEVMGAYVDNDQDRVYEAFRREDHLHTAKPDPNRPLLWALDFNVDPMSSVVVQRVGHDLFVLDEIVISRATTEQACREFQNRFGNHAAGLMIYGDASGNHRQTTGLSDYQVIREFMKHHGLRVHGYKVPAANPPVRDRLQLMNARLRNAAGEIRLKVDARCKELIRDFEEVRYVASTSLIDKDRDPRRTHLSDALGYLVWQEFGPRPVAGEQGQRLL